MIPMDLAQIAAAVGGTVAGDAAQLRITHLVADSRAAGPGDLVVAIPGERVDGYDFLPQAAAAGAVAAIATRPAELPTVVVADPVAALGDLARTVVADLPDLTVVAVTGIVGQDLDQGPDGGGDGRCGVRSWHPPVP